MTTTRHVRYRRLTPDEVLTELRLFCRDRLGMSADAIGEQVRPDAALGPLVEWTDDFDWGDLEPYFHVKLRRDWWAQWKPDHTVGELCENLATGTLVPVLVPVTILGSPCESAGAFLTLKQMLADDGADVSELGPSSEVRPYLLAKPDVFGRFRLATRGRLSLSDGVAPWSCLVGSLLVIAGAILIGSVGVVWLWLFTLGAAVGAFGLCRPTRDPMLHRDGLTTFRDLIHAAVGRIGQARTA